MLEVNGLADFGVEMEPIRKGGKMRGLVTGFRVSWWRKDVPDLQAAYGELKRPKVGRRARLQGRVGTVAVTAAFGQNACGADLLSDIKNTPRFAGYCASPVCYLRARFHGTRNRVVRWKKGLAWHLAGYPLWDTHLAQSFS
jgi:hypothetical protein